MISAAIIAALGVTALRSDEFTTTGRAVPPPAAGPQAARPMADNGLQYMQSILWSPPQAELMLRSIVYYIVDSEPTRDAYMVALANLSNSRFKLDEGGPEEISLFVMAATPEQEAEAQQEISRAAERAEALGHRFQVFDLREAGD